MVQQIDNNNGSISQTVKECLPLKSKKQKQYYGHRNESHRIIYFKEMAEYSTLSSEEEISLGLGIRSLREEIWEILLHSNEILDFVGENISILGKELPQSLLDIKGKIFEEIKNLNSKISDKTKKTANNYKKASVALNQFDPDEIILSKVLSAFGFSNKNKISEYSKLNKASRKKIHSKLTELKRFKHIFINANLRLVISVARKYNNGPMNLIDLIQEGNIGLMKAVDRFDPDRGYRFSTYAAWWIRHAVSRASADKGRTVRLPVHFIESYQQLLKIKKQLQLSLNRVPNSLEIALEMGISRKKVDRILNYLREGTLSLDRNVNSDDSRSFMDLLEDPSTENGVCPVIIKKVEITLSKEAMLNVLSPIERDIISKRFGLSSEEPRTLKDIGSIYNLSRERIRQIQENALKKMRKYFLDKGMI